MVRHPVLTVAVALIVLAGCTETKEPSVATAADQSAPAAQSSASPTPTPGRLPEAEKGILYARCMTANGVEIKDPVDGAMPIIMFNGNSAICVEEEGDPEPHRSAA